MAFLDETGLAELWSLIRAEDAKLAAADVKIATGSYAGTYLYGETNAISLTFDFVPKFIIIFGGHSRTGGFINCRWLTSNYTAYCCYYQYLDSPSKNTYAKIDGTTLSWYSTENPNQMFNNEPYNASLNYSNYTYIAFG